MIGTISNVYQMLRLRIFVSSLGLYYDYSISILNCKYDNQLDGEEDPNSEESPVILLNGKELTPYIEFDYAINNPEEEVMEDVPVQDVKLEEIASSWSMNFITRRELYKEDPGMVFMDEIDVKNGRAEYKKEQPPDNV